CESWRTRCSGRAQRPLRFDRAMYETRSPTMESSSAVEARASEWLARRDGELWNAADQQQLDQWLEESTTHVVAFLRLEAAWSRADRFKALGAGVPAGKVPEPEDFNRSPFLEVPSPRGLSREDERSPAARNPGARVHRRGLALAVACFAVV